MHVLCVAAQVAARHRTVLALCARVANALVLIGLVRLEVTELAGHVVALVATDPMILQHRQFSNK